VDPVDGDAAASHRHARSTRGSAPRARARSRRSAWSTASRTWSGSAARTARSRSPRSARGHPARSSRACSPTPTSSTSTARGPRSSSTSSFDVPERRFSAGAAYLRGQGEGKVAAVDGIEAVREELGAIVVEAKLPKPGQPVELELRGRRLRDRPSPRDRGRGERPRTNRLDHARAPAMKVLMISPGIPGRHAPLHPRPRARRRHGDRGGRPTQAAPSTQTSCRRSTAYHQVHGALERGAHGRRGREVAGLAQRLGRPRRVHVGARHRARGEAARALGVPARPSSRRRGSATRKR
jgi:hypothetical protein